MIDIKTKIAITFVSLLLLTGCASTSIETPIGTYTSTRDSQLDQLTIQIIKSPDGTETTTVQVNGASGDASSVIESQESILRAIIEGAVNAGIQFGKGGG